jgi:hypothetical protein
MTNIINRSYPECKNETSTYSRYTDKVFDEYIKMKENPINYEKWKAGVNYKTNRNLVIGGSTHNKLKNDFMIKYIDCNIQCSVFFEDLVGIDCLKYLQETENINQNNETVKLHNKNIREVVNKINKLEKWDDYVEFEGLKYGILPRYNNIHREYDCNGTLKTTTVDEYECRGCRDGMPFNGAYTCSCKSRQLFECEKCGYKK